MKRSLTNKELWNQYYFCKTFCNCLCAWYFPRQIPSK